MVWYYRAKRGKARREGSSSCLYFSWKHPAYISRLPGVRLVSPQKRPTITESFSTSTSDERQSDQGGKEDSKRPKLQWRQ
eukprot:scaffold13519_cov99-Cylindrotheca_fusiformis.AAC.1